MADTKVVRISFLGHFVTSKCGAQTVFYFPFH